MSVSLAAFIRLTLVRLTLVFLTLVHLTFSVLHWSVSRLTFNFSQLDWRLVRLDSLRQHTRPR